MLLLFCPTGHHVLWYCFTMMLKNVISRYGLLLIIGLSTIIHIALFFYDLNNPEAYLVGDRAGQRISSIERLQQTGSDVSVVDILVSSGSPGDYIFHSLIYTWQGIPGIILIQVLLQLIAIIYIYRIGLLIFGSSNFSLLATSIYAFLPSGLFHPHVLVTEAFFNPLVIVSFFYGVSYLSNIESPKVRYLLVAGLVGSCASFIRFIYVLYPLLFAGVILLLKRPRCQYQISHTVSYLAASFVIPLLWASYMFVQTGDFTMGETRYDFKYNLYTRIVRMGRLTSIELSPEQQQRRRLQLSEYLDYVFEYPTAYLKTLRSDISNIVLNSGINSLLGRYLGLYKMSNKNKKYWHDILDKEGLWKLVKGMYEYSLPMLLVNLLVAPLWFIFIGFVVFGSYIVVTNKRLSLAVRTALVLLPVYLFLTSQIASSVRWGFRTPFEFILVLLFVATVSWLLERRGKVIVS